MPADRLESSYQYETAKDRLFTQHFSKNTFSDKASVQEFLFRKLPHNLILYINILTRLDLHYLQQSLRSYCMK